MEKDGALRHGLKSRPMACLLLALAILVFAWSHAIAVRVSAGTPGVDLSIEVVSAQCDTKGVDPTTCEVAPGSEVTVSVSMNDVSGLPDADVDTKAGYLGVQVRLNYTAGLTLKQRSGVSEVVWPDCAGGFPAENKGLGTYTAGCVRGTGANESVFTGIVFEVDFDCIGKPGSQSVTMEHGVPEAGNPVGDTHVVDESGIELAQSGSESLTINCARVGGIAELPDIAEAPVEEAGSSGPNMVLIAGVAAIALVALAGTAWYARRRWSR